MELLKEISALVQGVFLNIPWLFPLLKWIFYGFLLLVVLKVTWTVGEFILKNLGWIIGGAVAVVALLAYFDQPILTKNINTLTASISQSSQYIRKKKPNTNMSYIYNPTKVINCPQNFQSISKNFSSIQAGSQIKLKKGVDVSKLDTRMVGVLPIILQEYQNVANNDFVITSGNDSRHARGSRHYKNQAIDLRIHGLSSIQAARIALGISQKLGAGYRVLYGDSGHKDHIHVAVLDHQDCEVPKIRI